MKTFGSVHACLVVALCAGAAGCATTAPAKPQASTPRTLREVPAPVLFERGKALGEIGDHVASEQFLLAAQRRGYPEGEVVFELVRVCIEGGRLDSALAHALPYLERHPDDVRLRHVVATVHLAGGDSVRAHEQLSQVLESTPAFSEAHFLMAVVLRDEFRDQEAARAHFAEYLLLDPRGEHASEAQYWMKRGTRPVQAPAREEMP